MCWLDRPTEVQKTGLWYRRTDRTNGSAFSGSCKPVLTTVFDEAATLAQRNPGIRPSPAGSLIGCHGQQEIFDPGNVVDHAFLPSLDAESEACRVLIHASGP